MLVPDRRRLLLERVRAGGSAEVEHLAEATGVSASTIRRDLALLEAEGLLRRTRGGAFLAGDDTRPAAETGEQAAAKRRIAARAAQRLEDGMTAMVLAGSTTTALVPHLARRTLTIVTNGLEVAHRLSAFPGISLVVLGGLLHREQMTMLGPMSERSMAELHVDVMLAGAYGVDPVAGVTGAKIAQAGYRHAMLDHTDALVVLADATKLGRRGPTLLAELDQVHEVLTDAAAPTRVLAELRARGARVTVCR